MPFDRFKTQVLLLHSEQSALDAMSTGFSDRYTVHCATSGSEALNTLGDTPIHVIVSAQDLPGMSGVEALREAKKRSPDTIGILLAGSKNDDVEALVGDKEVFQVVRGGISPGDLGRLIDNATQQARLIALAESANDTAANPDEPVTEHIIMETSENGSSIISGHTGRLPILDPKKVSASAAVGASTVDVLVMTKDEDFLATIKESTRGMHNVRYANTLKQADEAVQKHKVGVAVIDAAMVGQNVEKLTQHLRKAQKRLVAIVAGRRDDGEMLMDLINRGKVYRFLLKPVSPGRARLAVEASVKHHVEAPDSAFRSAGKPAAAPPRPAIKAVPTPKPKPKAVPSKKPVEKPKAAPPPPRPRPEIKASKQDALARHDDGLDDAFAGDDSSFTETMTGIVSTVTRSITGLKGAKAEQPKSPELPARPSLDDDIGDTGSKRFLNPKIAGAAVVGVLALLGGGYWLMSDSEDVQPVVVEPVATPSITEAEPDFGAATRSSEPVIDIDDLLEEARLAREAGQIFNPPGNNAIELYMDAVATVPDNAIAAAELDATIDEALGMAENALLERRADDASAALARVALADPDHARLPFLNAQIAQIQLRDYLDGARAAIRESRLEDAATALAAAETLDIKDRTEIDVVAEELQLARSNRRVDEVLALANQRLEESALTSPANDNARYYYRLALSNDPDNAAARTGLSVVASKIVLQARAEIDGGRFNTAEALLDEARQLDPESADLAASTEALAEARRRADEERQRAEAERRAAAVAAAAAAEQAAREQAAAETRRAAAQPQQAPQQVPADEPQRPAAQAADATPANAAAEPEPRTLARNEEPDPLTVARNEQPDPLTVARNEQAERPAIVPVRDQQPVPISTLNRTKYVAPKYPRSAERRNLSGWVDVVFTIAMDGSVKDIDVIGSDPGDVFVDSAVTAVEKWRFEPVIEDGVLVEKRAGVRMMYALE